MTTQIVIKEITPLAENTTVTVAEGLNLVQRFNNLVDTPSNYIGQAGKYPRVNQTEDALEFDDADAETFKGKPQSHYLFGDNERGTQRWETGVDSITKSGPWYVTTDLTGLPLNVDGYVLHEQRDDTDDYAKQTYTPNNDNRTFTRIKVGGVYGEWEETQTERWREHAQGQAELEEMRRRNRNQFAASGFEHFGKHSVSGTGSSSINEGLFSFWTSGNDNRCYMGRSTSQSAIGTSKTDFPVTHIAGIISELIQETSGFRYVTVKFPDAPDGTVIFDNLGDARGTGNTNLNLLNEVDPKYGNIANTNTEAAARAFEHAVSNGNFRDGSTKWDTNDNYSVSGGVMVISGTGSSRESSNGIVSGQGISNGDEVEISITIQNVTSGSVGMYCSGTTIIDVASGTGYQGNGTWTARGVVTDASALRVRIRNVSTTTQAEVANVSLRKLSEEVVIDRHDMFGGEFFLEEVSISNPYVYPNGMIQNKSTHMNNIATSRSNRPDTYYSVFEGDTNSTGLGVDFWDATEQQKIDMVSDTSNNIFLLDDGRLAQWRMRQVTIAAIGNGDWRQINPEQGGNSGYGALRFISAGGVAGRVEAQGARNTKNTWTGDTNYQFRDSLAVQNASNDRGVFRIHSGNSGDVAIDNQCYFHVWGVVRRLNRGAYHPSFNPLGTGTFIVQNVNWFKWNGRHARFDGYKSTSECFEYFQGGNDGVYPANINAASNTVGRDDDRRYDGIYNDGDGGINDNRLSAWEMDKKTEAAKVVQKVINGTYRGEEERYGSKVYALGSVVNDYAAGNYRRMNCSAANLVPFNCSTLFGRNDALPHFDHKAPRMGYVVDGDTGNAYRCTQTRSDEAGVTRVYLSLDTVAAPTNIPNAYFIASPNTTPSGAVTGSDVDIIFTGSKVSGDFLQADVIGHPLEILNTPDFANGWAGGWIPIIPDGSPKQFAYTRKNKGAVGDGTDAFASNDRGANWGASSINTDTNTGNIFGNSNQSISAQHIYYIPYFTAAKVTETTTNLKVLNGQEGLGSVFATHHNNITTGALFVESLTGKVPTGIDSSVQSAWGYFALSKPNTDHVTRSLVNYSNYIPEHEPIELYPSGSPAVKALWYQTSENQQANINFCWNELVYSSLHDAPSDFTSVDGSVSQSYTAGNTYRIHNANHNGGIWRCLTNITTTINGSFWNPVGDALMAEDTVVWFRRWTGNGYGDNNKISIANQDSTYTNYNGDICLRGNHKLTKPIGYSRNQARAGEQTTSVDL